MTVRLKFRFNFLNFVPSRINFLKENESILRSLDIIERRGMNLHHKIFIFFFHLFPPTTKPFTCFLLQITTTSFICSSLSHTKTHNFTHTHIYTPHSIIPYYLYDLINSSEDSRDLVAAFCNDGNCPAFTSVTGSIAGVSSFDKRRIRDFPFAVGVSVIA